MALSFENRLSDDAATSNICRILESWNSLASSNQTSAHNFRIYTSFSMIAFGAVAGTLFVSSNLQQIGVIFFAISCILAVILDKYHYYHETAWSNTTNEIQSISIDIASIGYKNYILENKNLLTPNKLFGDSYRNQNLNILKPDTTSFIILAIFIMSCLFTGTMITLYEKEIISEIMEVKPIPIKPRPLQPLM